MPIHAILKSFGFDENNVIESFGSGLINHTWKITNGSNNYILQKINHHVFKNPEAIDANINFIGAYLIGNYPHYKFVKPLSSANNRTIEYKDGYFRIFPFIENSHSKDIVETPEQAYEAASQFGKFTSLLSGIDIRELQTTIPDFHNLSLRYTQFLHALENGSQQRIKKAASLIEKVKSHEGIVSLYERITGSNDFKLRVTHHDTKISNVLFDDNDKGLCVIDLDTVMPGYFISDVGDMMRTYLSPVSEEEKDFSKIVIRDEFYRAVVQGYYEEMKDVLTETEKTHFFYAGTFIIYMQALRFLTDYINDDVYYGEKYPEQNLVRAGNQFELLQRLLEKKEKLEGILYCDQTAQNSLHKG
ncbi:aminoglycoside phosphotransferase family protein [Chitinophagaceae bacterium 26-R-25]|nr:aminoglycoside phosphotransferase family protein [Chitinophagaceae bacterium 26-R-25]